MYCYCQGMCPNGEANGTCLAPPGAGCFASAEEVYDPETESLVAERTYGCLPPEERGLMMCRGALSPHANPVTIECCKSGDFCNRLLFPMYEKTESEEGELLNNGGHSGVPAGINPAVFHLVLLCTVTVCIVSLVFFVTCMYLKYKRREVDRQRYIYRQAQQSDQAAPNGSLKELLEQSSGSGVGLPLLVQRTIAKQVQMVERVGQGRMGEVWLARWRGENVAVKVFYTTEEASWFRETEIYQTVLMRHDNILGFIAADIKGSGGWTQMLLVTDYHPLGSLYHYLTRKLNNIFKNLTEAIAHHPQRYMQLLGPPTYKKAHVDPLQINGLEIDIEQCIVLAHSIACGLSHLHTEIFGSRGKPAIAHRDLKSRNILVKNDGTAAIADFGLAVRYSETTQEVDIQPNNRLTTFRYMAPEMLENSTETFSFEAYKSADVYSFSLVIWELITRTRDFDSKFDVDPYELPYANLVGQDPKLQDMYTAVCIKKIRPEVPPRWNRNDQMQYMVRQMGEGWSDCAAARPTALRLKKNLSKLLPALPVPGNPVRMV